MSVRPGLIRPHGQAGQDCGELETSLNMAVLGQGRIALGADMESWSLGRLGRGPRGGQEGPVRPFSAFSPDKLL